MEFPIQIKKIFCCLYFEADLSLSFLFTLNLDRLDSIYWWMYNRNMFAVFVWIQTFYI